MLFILIVSVFSATLKVVVQPEQDFTVTLLRGGNYACLDVTQEQLPVDFHIAQTGTVSADVKDFEGVLATVQVDGQLLTDCQNVMITKDNQEVQFYVPVELIGDTVILHHENDIVFNLFAEFNVENQYCLASYLQQVCRGAIYSKPSTQFEMIQLQDNEADNYLWFLDGVATEYSDDPQPISTAKFVIKYFTVNQARPIAALRQPYLKKGEEVYVSWLAFCSDGDGKVAYFGAWFNDEQLNNMDRNMPKRQKAQFPDTRYCQALWQQINST